MKKNTRSIREMQNDFFEHLMTMNLERAQTMIADHMVLDESDALPFGGFYRGPQGIVDLSTNIQKAVRNFTFEIDIILTDEIEYIAFEGRLSGELKFGRFENMPLIERWRWENDKATEIVVCWHDSKLIWDLHHGVGAAGPAAS